MLKKPQQTTFTFILSQDDLFKNLDNIKMNDYNRFVRIGEIGKKIQELSKDQNQDQLKQLVDNHYLDIQFMKLEIQDAFISALHLRNYNIVKYFLNNGINLDAIQPDCIVQLCYSLQYLRHDPPIQLLKLLLQYGGNPRQCQPQNSDSALHLASKYGNIQFIKLLLEYGADINSINNFKITPLGYAIKYQYKEIVQYLKSKQGRQQWNY